MNKTPGMVDNGAYVSRASGWSSTHLDGNIYNKANIY